MTANATTADQLAETITPTECRSLFGVAAMAAGGAPEDSQGYAKWYARVATIASDLDRLASSYAQRASRLANAERIAGHIIAVDVITRGEGGQKGRIVFRPLSGDERSNPDAREDIATSWLSDADAAMVFEQAKLYIGRDVLLFKEYEKGVDGQGKSRNFRVCIGIEATGMTSNASGRTEAHHGAPPAAAQAPAAEAPAQAAPAAAVEQQRPQQQPAQRAAAQAATTAPQAAPPAAAAAPAETAPAPAADLHVVGSAAPVRDDTATALALVVTPCPDSAVLLKLAEDNQMGLTVEQVKGTIVAMYGPKLASQRLKGEYGDTWVALLAGKYLNLKVPSDVKATIEQVCGPLSDSQPERSSGQYAKIWLALTQEVGSANQAVGF